MLQMGIFQVELPGLKTQCTSMIALDVHSMSQLEGITEWFGRRERHSLEPLYIQSSNISGMFYTSANRDRSSLKIFIL